jgi:hypothetical protein
MAGQFGCGEPSQCAEGLKISFQGLARPKKRAANIV